MHELFNLIETITIFGHIPHTFLAVFTPEVRRMRNILHFCQELMFPICFYHCAISEYIVL